MKHLGLALTVGLASLLAAVWAQGPLLLDDDGEEDSGEMADNGRCHVCHLNMAEEELATDHARAGMACGGCHGDCDDHIADESWAEGGNGTAPGAMFAPGDVNPLCSGCHTDDNISDDNHQAFLADNTPEERCTDCHGAHRLKSRKLKWQDMFSALLLADHTAQSLMLHSIDEGIVWSQEAPALFDAWVRPNGNVVYATKNTVVEIVPDLDNARGGRELWTYALGDGIVGGLSEEAANGTIYSCEALDDGGVLIVESGTFRLVELDSGGKVRKAIPLPLPTQGDADHQLRLGRKTPRGTYLVGYFAEGVFRELNTDGEIVNAIDVKPYCDGGADSAYEAIPLENGHILISCGPNDRVIEVSAEGELVWTLDTADVPDMDMRWVTSLERLPSGNTLICNYAESTSPVKAFEVTPDKRVVWQLSGHRVQGLTRLQTLGADYKPVP